MSIKLMSAVWELDLPMPDKFVLLAFADHSDDSGFCYPSLARIAWKCGFSEDTARRCIARAKESGLMKAIGTESGGRGHATRYRIDVTKGRRLQPFIPKGSQVEAERVATKAEKGSNGAVKGSTAVLPESSFESSLKQIQPQDAPSLLPEEVRQKREHQEQLSRLQRILRENRNLPAAEQARIALGIEELKTKLASEAT